MDGKTVSAGSSIRTVLATLFPRKITPAEQIQRVATRVEGGIFRRLDENREFLEQLYEQSPDLLVKNHWIISCLKAHDNFFVELARSTEALAKSRQKNGKVKSQNRCRPWPSAINKEIQNRVKDIQTESTTSSSKIAESSVHEYYKQGIISKIDKVGQAMDNLLIGSDEQKRLAVEMKKLQIMLNAWDEIYKIVPAML